MKIKKVKFKQILKLYLLNSRAYDYSIKNKGFLSAQNFNLSKAFCDFKKALHIIFQFHSAGKRILFVGTPQNLEFKINKQTQHTAVPHDFDLQGVLLGNFKASRHERISKRSLFYRNSHLLLPKLLKKPDLVVLLSHEKSQNLINESHIAKVPVIIFISDPFDLEVQTKCSYSVLMNNLSFIQGSDKNIFYLGLNFLFNSFRRKIQKQRS